VINHFSTDGYNDFLIDIGANIGLTSCQNGDNFKIVHMYEPNPYCCKILEVNTAISIKSAEYHIHNYGMGPCEMEAELKIPLHNWGGAFIRDAQNSYDDITLASKDLFNSFNESNYSHVPIKLCDTYLELQSLFDSLKDKGFKKGVIKIDVEGYEATVLEGIAKAIPPEIEVAIIFESWEPKFNMPAIVKMFNGRATSFKLVRDIPWHSSWPKLAKLIALILKREVSTTIESNLSSNWKGDLVLKVKSLQV
jgi:FkbM family methyltransferase